MRRRQFTEGDFNALVAAADNLAHMAHGVPDHWPFSQPEPFKDLEESAQTVNRCIENLASVNRAILAQLAHIETERRLRKELTA